MQASCCPFCTYVTESLARLDVFYSSRLNVSLLGYYYLRMAMWEMSPLICSISVYFLKYQYLLLLYPHVKYHNNMLYQSPPTIPPFIIILCLLLILYSHAGKNDYDLLVIGGGSGGLACSKEGEVLSLLFFNFSRGIFEEPANNMITFCSGTTGTESGCVRLCGTICQR